MPYVFCKCLVFSKLETCHLVTPVFLNTILRILTTFEIIAKSVSNYKSTTYKTLNVFLYYFLTVSMARRLLLYRYKGDARQHTTCSRSQALYNHKAFVRVALCVEKRKNNMTTNNKSNVSAYVAECKENATIVASLEVLNDYRKTLLSECTNTEVIAARKALEEARSKFNKLATAYVLGEESYSNLQTECVRAAVSEFSHTHNVPRFFQWFNDNGKDEQTTIIDSVQRLGSKLASLHTSFASGSKVARKQKASEEDLTERIAKLQAELAAFRGEK